MAETTLNPVQAVDCPVVVAADPQTAQRLSNVLGQPLSVTVLFTEDHRSAVSLDRHALNMLRAAYFVYQSDRETLLQAMYRERLAQHGVTVVDLTPHRQRLRAEAPRELRSLLSDQLASRQPNR